MCGTAALVSNLAATFIGEFLSTSPKFVAADPMRPTMPILAYGHVSDIGGHGAAAAKLIVPVL
jgi:hypothetical protein